MYKRYIIVGLFCALLVGAYFIFFRSSSSDKKYEQCYKNLVNKGEYSENIDGIHLEISEIEENEKYTYIVTFDGATEIQKNVKILIANSNSDANKIEYFPSFGIVDNENYSIVSNNEDSTEVKGVNLTILDSEKIEYLLIYYSSNDVEQFARIKVSNYLA